MNPSTGSDRASAVDGARSISARPHLDLYSADPKDLGTSKLVFFNFLLLLPELQSHVMLSASPCTAVCLGLTCKKLYSLPERPGLSFDVFANEICKEGSAPLFSYALELGVTFTPRHAATAVKRGHLELVRLVTPLLQKRFQGGLVMLAAQLRHYEVMNVLREVLDKPFPILSECYGYVEGGHLTELERMFQESECEPAMMLSSALMTAPLSFMELLTQRGATLPLHGPQIAAKNVKHPQVFEWLVTRSNHVSDFIIDECARANNLPAFLHALKLSGKPLSSPPTPPVILWFVQAHRTGALAVCDEIRAQTGLKYYNIADQTLNGKMSYFSLLNSKDAADIKMARKHFWALQERGFPMTPTYKRLVFPFSDIPIFQVLLADGWRPNSASLEALTEFWTTDLEKRLRFLLKFDPTLTTAVLTPRLFTNLVHCGMRESFLTFLLSLSCPHDDGLFLFASTLAERGCLDRLALIERLGITPSPSFLNDSLNRAPFYVIRYCVDHLHLPLSYAKLFPCSLKLLIDLAQFVHERSSSLDPIPSDIYANVATGFWQVFGLPSQENAPDLHEKALIGLLEALFKSGVPLPPKEQVWDQVVAGLVSETFKNPAPSPTLWTWFVEKGLTVPNANALLTKLAEKWGLHVHYRPFLRFLLNYGLVLQDRSLLAVLTRPPSPPSDWSEAEPDLFGSD